MTPIILRGKDGRRWLLVNGGGLCVELKSKDIPEPVPEPKRRVRVRKDGW